jgi:hypothetical protein
VYLDLDGTLINTGTMELPAAASPPPFPLTMPGITYHSAVESQLFDTAECIYVDNGGAICRPELTFRRCALPLQLAASRP